MATTYWNARDWKRAGLLTLCFSILLTWNFVPTSLHLAETIASWLNIPLGDTYRLRCFTFPALALIFSISVPTRKSSPTDFRLALSVSIVPLIIGVVFAYFAPNPPGNFHWAWYLLSVPIGEELLFRGWFYALIERVRPRSLATFTNPLPGAVWSSALAFSLWHLQNLQSATAGAVLFQCSYTFLAGLWLGLVRWKTQSVLLPILFHALLNAWVYIL